MSSDQDNTSFEWLEAELQDTLDEDFEIEFAEPMLSMELRKIYRAQHPEMLDRKVYFRNLLRLQAELIKVQDWVQHTGAKVCILFEGRDSAGKGGVIKRITQRLNPWPCPRPAVANKASGISSATCRICQLRARSSCLTALGTTAPVSNA